LLVEQNTKKSGDISKAALRYGLSIFFMRARDKTNFLAFYCFLSNVCKYLLDVIIVFDLIQHFFNIG
jgi:hypothetical protein